MLKPEKTGLRKSPPRVLLYGVEGVGKSTFAANMPSAIFIQTEDGLDNIDAEGFPLARTLADVNEAIKFIANEAHTYKTLVIDSADWLEKLVNLEVMRRHGVKSIEAIGYGKGYTEAGEIMSGILGQLSEIRESRKMAIVVIAHARVTKFADPTGEAYDRYEPNLSKQVGPMMREWADDVLFVNFRVTRKTSKDGRSLASVAERTLFASDRPSHVAKTRSGIPDELGMSAKEYLAARRLAREASQKTEVEAPAAEETTTTTTNNEEATNG